jgi:hypothetical protein
MSWKLIAIKYFYIKMYNMLIDAKPNTSPPQNVASTLMRAPYRTPSPAPSQRMMIPISYTSPSKSHGKPLGF